MFSMSLGRPLYLSELWLCQGFPHPACTAISERLRGYFPFPNLVADTGDTGHDEVQRLSANGQRDLIGNSMHWAQLGSWLLYCLAFVGEGARAT